MDRQGAFRSGRPVRVSGIGEQLFEFEPREVRRLLVDQYEIRYEIQGSTFYVLVVAHPGKSLILPAHRPSESENGGDKPTSHCHSLTGTHGATSSIPCSAQSLRSD